MRNFFKKIYYCMFNPTKICFFFGEKIYKSILQLLILTLVAISPAIVSYSFTDRMSNESYRELEDYMMEVYSDFDVTLTDGKLEGEVSRAIMTNEAIVYVNPTEEPLELSSVDQTFYFVIELRQETVDVSIFGIVVQSKTYEELGVTELDFNKINEASYTEFDTFIYIVNQSFASVRVGYILINSVITLLDVYLTILLSALILALIVKLFARNMPFAIRFKGALDAQYISLVFMLLMLLFDFDVLRYGGILFSAIYFVITIIQTLKIEVVMKNMNNINDNK